MNGQVVPGEVREDVLGLPPPDRPARVTRDEAVHPHRHPSRRTLLGADTRRVAVAELAGRFLEGLLRSVVTEMPIPVVVGQHGRSLGVCARVAREERVAHQRAVGDRKSTRLNSSHSQISYAVFCLKKKKKKKKINKKKVKKKHKKMKKKKTYNNKTYSM